MHGFLKVDLPTTPLPAGPRLTWRVTSLISSLALSDLHFPAPSPRYTLIPIINLVSPLSYRGSCPCLRLPVSWVTVVEMADQCVTHHGHTH